MDEANTPDLASELGAMSAMHIALKELPPESQKRVIRWAMSAFGVQVTSDAKPNMVHEQTASSASNTGGSNGTGDYTSFSDLLGDSGAVTDADRALVGGYWLQVIMGHEDFSSQAVNEELKNTGNAIGNITRAFDNLKATKPQLVRQLLKSGRSQQARKKLKLTTSGMDRVRRMIAGGEDA